MSRTQHAGPLVWPVQPAAWDQGDANWVAEIQLSFRRDVERMDAVTVQLPDGRLVHYEAAALGRFLEDWQFTPPVIPDCRI